MLKLSHFGKWKFLHPGFCYPSDMTSFVFKHCLALGQDKICRLGLYFPCRRLGLRHFSREPCFCSISVCCSGSEEKRMKLPPTTAQFCWNVKTDDTQLVSRKTFITYIMRFSWGSRAACSNWSENTL